MVAVRAEAEVVVVAFAGDIVEQLRDDLGAVAKRIEAQQTDAGVQTAQREVEDLLELLINALRKTIELKEGGH